MTDFFEKVQSALVERYALEEQIGSGATAIVYLATDLRHGRKVALKVLRPELAGALASDRFLREIQIVSDLSHPYIADLYDSGQEEGVVYFVMPYVAGESLRERLAREGPLPVGDAIRVACEISEALGFLHRRGLVHRDIKPANVLLAEDHAILSDFGVAGALDRSSSPEDLTATGLSVGTPTYMSPEQVAPGGDPDARSDIYSLGCVLFEMLAGEPPFRGSTPQAVIARHLSEPPPSVRSIRRSISSDLDAVTQKALAKNPADRFASAENLLRALRGAGVKELQRPASQRASAEQLATVLSGESRVSGTRSESGWKAILQTLNIRTLISVVAVAAGAIGGWFLLGPGDGTSDLDANRIVVFPLIVPEETQVPASAGEDAATVIGHALDETGPLRWLDGWTLMSSAERDDVRILTLTQARSLAAAEGCGSLVRGRVAARGDSAEVFLDLYDARGGLPLAKGSAAGLAQDAWKLALQAVSEMLPTLIQTEIPDFGVSLTTRDPSAVANFLLAESSVRRALYSEALEYYEASFAADSQFALPAIRGAQAASWLHESDKAISLIEAALELPLSKRDEYFAKGVKAFFDGDADGAVAGYRTALGFDPDMAEAHFQLGEVYTHLLPTSFGRDSAWMAFRRARQLDPNAAHLLFHPIEIMIRRGDVGQAEEALFKFSEADADSVVVQELQLMLRCVQFGPGEVNWEEEVHRSPQSVLSAASELAEGASQLPCAESGYRGVLEHDTATDGWEQGRRWNALLGLQNLLLAEGRYEEAGELLSAATESLVALRTVAAGEDFEGGRGALKTDSGQGPCGPPIIDHRGVRGSEFLYLMDASAGYPFAEEAERVTCQYRERYGDAFSGRTPFALWFLGLWEAHQGHWEATSRIGEQIRERAPRSNDPRQSELLARAVDAHLALARGHSALARRLLESLSPTGASYDLKWNAAEPLGPERMALANSLMEEGEYERALRVSDGFDQDASISLLFLPASLEIRIQAAEALGLSDEAEEYRARLSALRSR